MQYYKSTSPTSLSGGSWSSTAPSAEDGYWIWTRLYIVFDDGDYSYTNAVCTTGATGSTGDYGPGLSYRGEYSSSTSYSWTTNSQGNVRDIVKYSGSFYAVNRSKKVLVRLVEKLQVQMQVQMVVTITGLNLILLIM